MKLYHQRRIGELYNRSAVGSISLGKSYGMEGFAVGAV